MKILPSLASADQMHLGDSIRSLKDYPYLHIDIEDGNFVPNISFGMQTVHAAAEITGATMDAHLMVSRPEEYLEDLAKEGVGAVAFHWESTGYPLRVINRIHQLGMKAGIALNPCTLHSVVLPYLDKIEYVLFMSSEPDKAAEAFQPSVLGKISQIAESAGGQVELIADGGIGVDEFDSVKKAGATGVVMGRTVFRAEDPLSVIERFYSWKGERACR